VTDIVIVRCRHRRPP